MGLGIQGQSPLQGRPQSQQGALSSAAKQLLKSAFNMSDVKVTEIRPGHASVDGLTHLHQDIEARQSNLLQSLAKTADPNADLSRLAIVTGGSALIEELQKELKKSLRTLDRDAVYEQVIAMGLAQEGDKLYFSESADVYPGGLLVIQSGLRELDDERH